MESSISSGNMFVCSLFIINTERWEDILTYIRILARVAGCDKGRIKKTDCVKFVFVIYWQHWNRQEFVRGGMELLWVTLVGWMISLSVENLLPASYFLELIVQMRLSSFNAVKPRYGKYKYHTVWFLSSGKELLYVSFVCLWKIFC